MVRWVLAASARNSGSFTVASKARRSASTRSLGTLGVVKKAGPISVAVITARRIRGWAWVLGRVGGGDESGADVGGVHHGTEDLALLVGFGELDDGRDIGKLGVLLQRELHDDVDLLLRPPVRMGDLHRGP